MVVQRVSEKDLIDEYLYRPPSPKQKKKLTKKKLAKKQKNKSWHLSSVLLHKSSPYMYYNCRFWYNLVWSTYLVFLSSQKYDFPIEKVQNLDFDRLCRPTRACPEGEIWLLWSPLYKRSYYKKRFVKSLNFFFDSPNLSNGLCPFLEI